MSPKSVSTEGWEANQTTDPSMEHLILLLTELTDTGKRNQMFDKHPYCDI